MKKLRLIYTLFFAGLAVVALTSNSGGVTSTTTCSGCHSGGAGGGSVSISGLPMDYTPGNAYVMTVTVTDAVANVAGFSLSIDKGTLSGFGSDVSSPSSTKATHNGAKTVSAGSASWSFTWTAPAASSGTATFTVGGNGANGNGANSGDSPYSSSASVSEFIPPPPADINFSSVTASVAENGTSIDVDVTISSSVTCSVEAALDAGSSSAEEGSDFTFSSPTVVNFTSGGSTTQTINIPITNDNLFEGNEDFKLILQNLTGSGCVIGSSDEVVVTITDEDPQPLVSFESASSTHLENEGVIDVNINMDNLSDEDVVIDLTLNTGSTTATNILDFTISPTSVTFSAGTNATQTIEVTIIDDAMVEPDESIVMDLSLSSGNASLGFAATNTLTIMDNEPDGISETLEENQIQLMVTNNTLNVSSNNTMQQIVIHDLSGKTIFNQKANSLTESIDLTGTQSGVYLVGIISSAGELTTGRIFK